MICLIASSKKHAIRWANSQHLKLDEWFHPAAISDLYKYKNYHVITVVEGIEEMGNGYLNMMLTTAWRQGKVK
jgi:hypothetical protein